MTHYMHLNDEPYAKIAAGTKTIELRLYDEKRRKIKAGDTIVFTRATSSDYICASVKALHIFPSFSALYAAIPPERCGYAPGEKAQPKDMEKYYSKEEEAQYGVVSIELSLL